MDKRGYLLVGISVLIFSTLEIVSKFIVSDFNPLQMNFLRFLIGGIILFPFAIYDIRKRSIKLSKKDIFILIGLGILAVPVSMSFFQLSLQYINASVVAVFLSTNSIFVTPLSYFILKEKADKSMLISLVLGFIGIAIITSPSFTIGSKEIVGIIYGIAAPITFALFSVLGKAILPRVGGIILNDFVFISGSVFMLPMLFLMKIPIFTGISSSNIFHLLYLGIVVTAIGYILMFKGLAVIPANKGTLLFMIKPFLAGTLAYLFLYESIPSTLIIGTLFILGSILLIVVTGNKTIIKEVEA